MAHRPRGGGPPRRSRSTGARTAPLGIKIYCVIAGLAGLYALFLSLRIVGVGGPFVALGVVLAALSVGYFVVLYGLWTLKPWAWTWGMIIFGIDLVIDLLRLDLLGVLISALLLAYLASKQSLYQP